MKCSCVGLQTRDLLISSPASYGYATEPQIIKITTSVCQPKVIIKGALHELNQMVNLMANHLVKRRHVARDANPRLKLT